MAARNGVLLTADDVASWQQEKDKLENEIRVAVERVMFLKRKLDAAEIFASAGASPSTETDSPDVDTEEDADSASNLLCSDMRTSGQALKVKQIRERLIALGFGDKLKVKPNYVYGLVYRLTRSGKLLKEGGEISRRSR